MHQPGVAGLKDRVWRHKLRCRKVAAVYYYEQAEGRNTIGAPLLGNATFDSLEADGYYCGDDDAAKAAVAPLIAATGLRPFDAGPLRNARYLEAMAMLWIDLAVKRGRGPTFGFRTLEHAAT